MPPRAPVPCTRRGRAGSFVGILTAIVLILVLSAAIALADPRTVITGSGCSVSNVGYLTDLAKEYERRSGTRVLVRGGGSVVGIEDLRSGNVDFAAACRPRAVDDPTDITFVQVAWDALVFIVHPTNTASTISLAQARSIYAGSITNWKNMGGPDLRMKVFVSRARKGLSGVEGSMRTLLLGGKEPVETPHASFVSSTGIVEQMIERTPEGFATTGFSSAQHRKVKMLQVDGVRPSIRSIVRNTYPLKRPLFLLLPKDPKPQVRKFVEFALSADGQRFISSKNIVSLGDAK
ncbi:MAG: substrate-binding domain-containing protein [Nitrospirota bacterium]|nr:substrate-binding domain-containing protein [Nitrospirota bacterium]